MVLSSNSFWIPALLLVWIGVRVSLVSLSTLTLVISPNRAGWGSCNGSKGSMEFFIIHRFFEWYKEQYTLYTIQRTAATFQSVSAISMEIRGKPLIYIFITQLKKADGKITQELTFSTERS